MKAKIQPGSRVRINEAYAQKISEHEWRGSVIRAHAPISGCWVVRVDNVPPLQMINEHWMELEQ